ncbi:MAG TPA: hypothetical protein PLW48_04890 [Alphaproteobacteria bacterium]|nr:hypothetical protein [Rhodospirillaceae bacterium]HRJ66452.1 hypothetical protein [Alphaproteobacteria bacterium]
MATRRPFVSLPFAALALTVLLMASAPVASSWAEERTVGVSVDNAGTDAAQEAEKMAERVAPAAAAPSSNEAEADLPLQAATEEAFDVDAAAAAAAHDGEHKKSGLPQLDPSTYPSQIFWLLVSFVLLYTLMSRVALPRVTEVLDMRQTQRDNNLNRAEHLQEDAAKIRQTLDASMAAAQAEAQATLSAREQENAKKMNAENARFMEHARNRITSAEQNISKAKEEALLSLADISAEVAADIVQKVSGSAANKNDAKKVVMKLMQEG